MKAWARFVAWISTREDAVSLAFARIVAGSSIAFNLASMHWSGADHEAWVDIADGGARSPWAEPWLQYFGPDFEGGCLDSGVHYSERPHPAGCCAQAV